jgi:F0F1-type ATP synthase delta subunit
MTCFSLSNVLTGLETLLQNKFNKEVKITTIDLNLQTGNIIRRDGFILESSPSMIIYEL